MPESFAGSGRWSCKGLRGRASVTQPPRFSHLGQPLICSGGNSGRHCGTLASTGPACSSVVVVTRGNGEGDRHPIRTGLSGECAASPAAGIWSALDEVPEMIS